MEKLFIDKNIRASSGDQAEKLLSGKNDMEYFEDNIGTKKAPVTRWNEAQEYESKTCLEVCRGMSNDRNDEHEKNFGGYSVLNQFLEEDLNIIELGCGPFTNLRLIFNKIRKTTKNVHLLDPLINKYMLNHPNCTFKTGMLNFKNVKTFNAPIEKFDNDITYDMVVMINVLEHCYDVDLIFEKIYKMLNEGGILIFSDVFIKDEFVKEWNENIYDAGHPIKLSQSYFEEKLKNYKSLYSNIIEKEDLKRSDMYYILKKL